MPQYEFECLDCSYRFTILVAWAEREKVRCPRCRSSNLKQVWSVFSARSKDYGGGGCQPAAKAG
ncbi:MAG: zinc ribbon domain-containing protein [Bacillota bacterium]